MRISPALLEHPVFFRSSVTPTVRLPFWRGSPATIIMTGIVLLKYGLLVEHLNLRWARLLDSAGASGHHRAAPALPITDPASLEPDGADRL